ncbi:MAG: hypothetical protein H6585_09935 [Flavobacteriales bacterium]|nr:hypothetical protein [Flavobacteriales bacterium]
MFSKDEIARIKEELPIRAAYIIHEKTNISRPTIYKFFNGGNVRPYYASEILACALELLEEKKNTLGSLRKKYNIIMEDPAPYGKEESGDIPQNE